VARRKAHLVGLDAIGAHWIASAGRPRNALRRATATFFQSKDRSSLQWQLARRPGSFLPFADATSSRAIAADPHSGAGRLPPTTRVQEDAWSPCPQAPHPAPLKDAS